MESSSMEKITKLLENDRFAKFNGIKLIEIKSGYAVAQMEVTDNHLNGVNMVQGGAIFTLADFAFAAAANATGNITLSLNASISFFKPPQGKIITAKATIISSSAKLCNYNVDIFDEDKELIAKMVSNGFIK
jgi:acyl-CoA thioesterase